MFTFIFLFSMFKLMETYLEIFLSLIENFSNDAYAFMRSGEKITFYGVQLIHYKERIHFDSFYFLHTGYIFIERQTRERNGNQQYIAQEKC